MNSQMIVPSDGQVIVSYRLCYKNIAALHDMFHSIEAIGLQWQALQAQDFFLLEKYG